MRTGYRVALGIVAATVLIAIVVAVVEAVGATRDARAYGELDIPGRDSVNLPEGDVIIFYGERIGRFEHSPLTVPPTLRLLVRNENGLLGSTPSGFNQFNDGDYVRRSIANLDVPEAGSYEAISPTRLPGATDPQISFGRNGTRDFAYVLFVLGGGLLLAAILGIGTKLVERRERKAGGAATISRDHGGRTP